MRRNTLYLLLAGVCIAGYGWLFYQRTVAPAKGFGVCMIKHATTIPCPSCGSTRAVLTLMDGDFVGSILLNPFGILIAIIMVVCPLWLAFDVFWSGDSLWKMYNQVELFFRRRWVGIASISLVTINWIWNIYKDV